MAFISPDDGLLTVVNLFGAATMDGQERLLKAMTSIIDNADYPGWRSSTLHGGQDARGTANYIQWRSLADLQARYEDDTFRHETVPEFTELSTSIELLRTEAVFAQQAPTESAPIEITPEREDYTVIIVFRVAPENQKELLDTLAAPDEWLRTVPGYRSHSYLRGLDGDAVVNYAQWESKEHYDAFHLLPEDQRPRDVRAGRQKARTLLTGRDANTYRVVHSRSAPA